jgi:hypothetical protein
MNKEIYSLFDTKAEIFGTPIYSQNVAVVLRDLQDEVNRVEPNNQLNKHTEDYELYHMGQFHITTGTFITHTPKLVCKLETLKEEYPAATIDQITEELDKVRPGNH